MSEEQLELPVEAEVLTGDESVSVNMGPAKVTILPRGKWRINAVEALRDGRYTDWAEGAMDTWSFETWLDINPTMDEVEAMFAEYAEVTGQGKALSRAQRRQYDRSQRRSR